MKIVYSISLCCMLCLIVSCSEPTTESRVKDKPNILFIAVDDLRPELGCYGNKIVKSPNIDRLAKEGTLFENHYVHVPTCGASRFSLLTGMLPRSIGHLSNMVIADSLSTKSERNSPESFVHQLRQNGYYTLGIGKISHMPDGYVYGYQEPISQIKEMPLSWDEFNFDHGQWGTGHNAFFGYADGTNRNDLNKQVKPYEAADVPDEGYPDGLTSRLAVQKLKELGKQEKPFFMAVGFFKPHLPFNAPKKYWDLYDASQIPLSKTPGLPHNVNVASLHGSGEFNQYALGSEKASLSDNVSDTYARTLRHAYYACVSYTDAQIGKLLDELKNQGLDKNTIIILWGDHGWHLGDQRVWGKHTLNQKSLRSPLIIKIPKQSQSQSINNVVSTIDIYPTILDLCQVDISNKTDGNSLSPLIRNPSMKWEYPNYAYFRKGISMRTDKYRLTKYYRSEQPNLELYNLETDPYEMSNVVDQYPDLVDALLPILEKGNFGLYENGL